MKLKELRQQAGYTQKELAEKVGMTQHYISQLETGVKNGSIQTLFVLSNALRVTVGELLGEKTK